jgi:8-oxo-dGTP pyrophosphatase MutT (NUDIX family)
VDFDSVVDTLRAALTAPLPGTSAQLLMAPRPPRSWPVGFDPARIRHAAGLVLLYPLDSHVHVVLTERSQSLEQHRGQISLPGGAIEAGETVEAAALREAHEEIGLERTNIVPLGALTPIDIPISGFRLHPVLAIVPAPPTLQPHGGEVARVLHVDLSHLQRDEQIVWRTLERGPRTISYPAFLVDGVEIWGATAMILAELLALLSWTGPGQGSP